MTQEELANVCKINVRTLQRIENGNVVPRSFTIKAIFNALNFDLKLLAQNNKTDEVSILRNFIDVLQPLIFFKNEHLTNAVWINRQLRIAGILVIIYAILGFPEAIFEIIGGELTGYMVDVPI